MRTVITTSREPSCNVAVRQEDDGSVTVAFMDPEAVLGLVDREDIEALAHGVRGRLERVRDALQARAAA